MYSVYWNKPLTEHFNVEAESLRPAACILRYPLTDYIAMKGLVANELLSKKISNAANIAYFGTTLPSEELSLRTSPARLVDSATPPTFLWTTYDDTLTPTQQTLAYAQGLSENKIPF